ncbi:hypothetical protein A6769_09260 [Nostoc punctiforme NIES-2108]|uniref:Methyltransferase domain-containing protein n=1 Tax=Nostoc punctiforme NIES-2108 TaxID=1356359 RepID=A0A367RPU4_NOSPU|nr:hypothetical protein A6769_09260 [Nostoc punctiforme NIES-2108]
MTDDSTITHEAFKQFERDKFSLVAQEYDRALAKLTGGIASVTSQVDEAILDAVEAKSGIRLLDVACGTGWLSAAALQRPGYSNRIRLCREDGGHCQSAMSSRVIPSWGC